MRDKAVMRETLVKLLDTYVIIGVWAGLWNMYNIVGDYLFVGSDQFPTGLYFFNMMLSLVFSMVFVASQLNKPAIAVVIHTTDPAGITIDSRVYFPTEGSHSRDSQVYFEKEGSLSRKPDPTSIEDNSAEPEPGNVYFAIEDINDKSYTDRETKDYYR
jgi:hypothetical protein